MVIAGTGHRHLMSDPRAQLRLLLLTLEPRTVISGMALGFDTLLAECAVELGVPLVAAVPCSIDVQPGKWPQWARERYYALLAKAAAVQVIRPGPYDRRAFQERNVYMVDACDLLVSYFSGEAGGTANCVKYAHSVGKPPVNLYP
jgi:uncharacterized phage-like protein YoqJ